MCRCVRLEEKGTSKRLRANWVRMVINTAERIKKKSNKKNKKINKKSIKNNSRRKILGPTNGKPPETGACSKARIVNSQVWFKVPQIGKKYKT